MIGPRNRRRLAIGAGIGLVATGAALAAVLLTRPGSHPRETLADPRWRCVGGPNPAGGCTMSFGGVVYGMSLQQMEHLLGKPTDRRGNCWLYPEQVGRYLAAKGVVKSEISECFFGGRLSSTSERDYVRSHGKLVLWRPPQPKP